MNNYYITTTAPYVNADPHIGFALEIVQADVLARYQRALGKEVFFNTGTDEHGKKIFERAVEEGSDPQTYVDGYVPSFDSLKTALNLSYNSFQRSTNQSHIEAAQEMWRRVKTSGYIEKGVYKAKYCVGCEMEKQDSELVEGKCLLHPNKEIEYIEEENYFFKFSDKRIASALLEYYEQNPEFVVPAHRLKEIRNFVESGLSDFSISRLSSKMPWGVPVPDDPEHVMYVWFDALTYYISALGFPHNEKLLSEFWGTTNEPNAIQVAGKDNLRQQTAMWQAMLFAAGLPFSKQILIHGFITSAGAKMSKSLGNVVNPLEYAKQYGTDALRYYLLAKITPFEDSDFTREKFEAAYVSDLQNGLGNLVARVSAMAVGMKLFETEENASMSKDVCAKLENYQFDEAIRLVWARIRDCDILINQKQVWKLKGAEKETELRHLGKEIMQVTYDLAPFLPETAERIRARFAKVIAEKEAPLFPRLG